MQSEACDRNVVQPTNHIIAVAVAISAVLLLSACASPVEGVWPPVPESATQTVIVSVDTWHAMIAFAIQPADSDEPSFEEWGYAERAWYLEGKTGVSGVVRALFWPTGGVVEVGYYDRVWANRTPQPPAELFVFRLSEESHQRLRQHLHSTLLNDEPLVPRGQSVFYAATRSYHLFHTCHQYAAHALREAGLPISPLWAFNRTSLAWQLRRAAQRVAQ